MLADDHAAIRQGLRLMLEADGDIEVIGEAADGETALSNIRALRPDVVLMDVRMPYLDGIEATAEVTQDGLAQVIILTSFELDDYVVGSLRAGASGFLLKTAQQHTITDAIRRVVRGESVLSPEVTRTVISRAISHDTEPSSTQASDGAPSWLAALTQREREVLNRLAQGMSNAAVADDLHISEATAKTHVSRVLTKMGCQSRIQAALMAQQLGLVT